MTALEIKEYIQKNGKIPYVLESIGCSNIVYHDNKDYYSCSNAVVATVTIQPPSI